MNQTLQDNKLQPGNNSLLLKHKRIILLVGMPLLVGIISVVVYLLGGRYVETDNAYIKAQKSTGECIGIRRGK